MPNLLLGYQAAAYYKTTPLNGRPGDTPTPDNTYAINTGAGKVWTLFDNITDLSLEADSESVDITTRAEAATGWSSEIFTTKRGRVSFSLRYKPGDTAFEQILKSWLNTSSTTGVFVAMMFLDQPMSVAGAMGIVANWSCSFSKDEPVKGLQTLKGSLSIAEYPDWVTSSGGGTPAMSKKTFT